MAWTIDRLPTKHRVDPMQQPVGTTAYTVLGPDTVVLVQRVTSTMTTVLVKAWGRTVLTDSFVWEAWQNRLRGVIEARGEPGLWWLAHDPIPVKEAQ